MSTERALKKAVHHVLRRMQNDGRVAWLLGPGSEAYDQLTAAFAAADGQELEKFRAQYEPTLRPQPWSPHDGLSGETIQQRDAVCEAWAALPDDLRKDQRLTRLYHALGGPRMDMPSEAVPHDPTRTS